MKMPIAAGALLTLLLGGCFFGGDKELKETCMEPQPYQAERPGKRIEVPEGLDALNEFREMPIPTAETAPRPEGARCLTSPPSIRSE